MSLSGYYCQQNEALSPTSLFILALALAQCIYMKGRCQDQNVMEM